MITLEEQIKSKCIYFTGLGNAECEMGIKYSDVKITSERPFKFPCLQGAMHGGNCEFRESPSDENVKAELAKIHQMEKNMLHIYSSIPKDKSQGQTNCPECKEETLSYSRNPYNGHVWGKCTKCDFGWME